MTYSGMVSCDECGKAFKVNPHSRPWGEGGVQHYFVCPHCKHEYIAASITATGRLILERMNRLREKLNEAQSQNDRKKLARRWERLRRQMDRYATGAGVPSCSMP